MTQFSQEHYMNLAIQEASNSGKLTSRVGAILVVDLPKAISQKLNKKELIIKGHSDTKGNHAEQEVIRNFYVRRQAILATSAGRDVNISTFSRSLYVTVMPNLNRGAGKVSIGRLLGSFGIDSLICGYVPESVSVSKSKDALLKFGIQNVHVIRDSVLRRECQLAYIGCQLYDVNRTIGDFLIG